MVCTTATTDNTTMKICVRVVVRLYAFVSGEYIHLGVKLLGHMIILCLTFSETAILFSKVAVAFCFPTAIHENSDHFPYALALDISLKKML